MGILEKALVHTLLGMGSVFIVLILIFGIISLFAFIPKIQARFTKTKLEPGPNPAAAAPKAAAPAPEVVAEEVDETDDLALVAVITAAIAASTGTSTDGFVVRSIKRAPAGRWKK